MFDVKDDRFYRIYNVVVTDHQLCQRGLTVIAVVNILFFQPITLPVILGQQHHTHRSYHSPFI